MENGFKITYNVDMVFCIDATESMGGILETVKNNALNFYNDVVEEMKKKGKTISQLRIRIVAFRDYLADGDNAMLVTDFFQLPRDTAVFESCVRSIMPLGGGDEPEDGLEALAYAMKSDWNNTGIKKRHVIVVWSDAPTHEIGYGRRVPSYPKNMAKSFPELSSWWGDRGSGAAAVMNQSAKRLLLFAPDSRDWNRISDNWDNVIHCPSVAGNGLNELDYRQIIDAISNTI